MTCKQLQETMLDYIDGKLEQAESTEFKVHLDKCASCQDELDHFLMLHDVLKTTEEIVPAPDYKEKFWSAVDRKNHFWNSTTSKLIYYGIAASLMIFLSILMFRYYPGTDQNGTVPKPTEPGKPIPYVTQLSPQDEEDDQFIMEMNDIIESPVSSLNNSFAITEEELKSISSEKPASKTTPNRTKSKLNPAFTAPLFTEFS